MDRQSTPHRRLRLKHAAVVLLGLSYAGCASYPDEGERVNDDIVFTGHAPDTDFSSFRTFAIDPEVHVATVEADDSIDMSTADEAMSDRVTDHIAQSLEARGFRQVGLDENPDLGVNVTGISGLNVGAVSGGYWWGSYSSYWGYPGWSYYYPYNVYYSYRPGSIVVDLADLSRSREDMPAEEGVAQEMPEIGGLAIVWTMVGYRAYLDEDVGSRIDDAIAAIDQAFEQSPYLTRK